MPPTMIVLVMFVLFLNLGSPLKWPSQVPMRSLRSSRFPTALTDTHHSSMSAKSVQYLRKIEDYGSNRMARRAVQVLDDMVSRQQFQPQEAHYTATVWACANSDMFDSAVEIFSRMREQGVAPTTSTYEALVSVAERSA